MLDGDHGKVRPGPRLSHHPAAVALAVEPVHEETATRSSSFARRSSASPIARRSTRRVERRHAGRRAQRCRRRQATSRRAAPPRAAPASPTSTSRAHRRMPHCAQLPGAPAKQRQPSIAPGERSFAPAVPAACAASTVLFAADKGDRAAQRCFEERPGIPANAGHVCNRSLAAGRVVNAFLPGTSPRAIEPAAPRVREGGAGGDAPSTMWILQYSSTAIGLPSHPRRLDPLQRRVSLGGSPCVACTVSGACAYPRPRALRRSSAS